MALEIRELILRTTLTDNSTNTKQQADQTAQPETHTEAIIAECIAQVMERLREENER